jgi:serine/threonine protein kinase
MRINHLELPGYEVLEVLGQGGFATVYRARQLAVGREVALKIDSRTLSSDRDRQRFMREVTAAGQLSGHPHVVAVYDAGVLPDGRPYMVLELCPGGSLSDRLHKDGPLPANEARDIGVRIADALAAAHAAGVLHRDIKPGNIMIDQYGAVALADFGLAAMPRPGHELSVTREALTPAYAPPEAFRMAEPTPAGDVYSLGATVYALLQGRPPHFPEEGSLSIAEIITRHDQPIPDLPGVSPALTEVLRHSMAPDPARRLPGAAALRDALAALAGTETVPIVPGRPVRPVRQARRRPRLAVPAVVMATVVVGAGGVLGYQQWVPDGTPSASPSSSSSTYTDSKATATASAGAFPGVATTTDNCPAASVAGLHAACTTTAECWGGMVVITGNVTITRSDCLATHVWETFAIAPLPSDGMTVNQQELEKHPDILRLCSREVMAKSRRGSAALAVDPADWTVDVLPPTPTQYADGLRVFRCVATVTGKESAAAYFRPRS